MAFAFANILNGMAISPYL